jgi:hypothetical protein
VQPLKQFPSTIYSDFEADMPSCSKVKERVAWPEDYKVFPSHKFSTQADRNAALTLMACIDAWQFMNEFVDGMLKGKPIPA